MFFLSTILILLVAATSFATGFYVHKAFYNNINENHGN